MLLKKTSALVLGALATTVCVSIVFAAVGRSPQAGSWQCFRTDRFPDPIRDPTGGQPWNPIWAASDHDAQVFAGGLNQIARNSVPGTVLSVKLDSPIGSPYPVICVKY